MNMIPLASEDSDLPGIIVNIRCAFERPWRMSSLSDCQSDAFDNPAQMACREGNLRVLREAAAIAVRSKTPRQFSDDCDRGLHGQLTDTQGFQDR
jgi:hypothetical protein